MAGTHVRLQDQSVVVIAGSAHLGYRLGGLPVHHLTIIKGSLHQHVGICLRLDVVVWRVGDHVIEGGLLLGISPLFEFSHCQWQ